MRNAYQEDTEISVNKVKKKHVISMLIWLCIMIFVFVQVCNLVLYTFGKKEKEKMWLYNITSGVINFFFNNKLSNVTENYNLKVAGLGDIYFTSNTIKSAKTGDTYDFTEGTSNIQELLKNYDLVTASLVTPIADSAKGYSLKDVYNAPSSVVDLLKNLNVSVVLAATSHALDKNESGISDTIKNLQSADISYTGISNEDNKPLIIDKNNIKVGLLSYAMYSNVKVQNDKAYLVSIYSEEKLDNDMAYLKENNVDFVIAYLNNENEQSEAPDSNQIRATENMFNKGVNVVLGSGSMVVQDEVRDEINIDNKPREIYAIYSLGDLFGSYEEDNNLLSVIANFEINKEVIKDKKGNIKESNTSIVVKTPVRIYTSVDKNYNKELYIVDDEIEKNNSGKSNLSKAEYEKMVDLNRRITILFEE